MIRNLERLKKAIWVLNQPLTKTPSEKQATVSDLFIWRNSDNWKTYFELIDIVDLFVDSPSRTANSAELCLFSCDGKLEARHSVELPARERKTLDLSQYLNALKGEYGSFSLFHGSTPECIVDSGSFVAERGYTAYRYKNSPFVSYVHGNLDAVARSSANGVDIQVLGSTSFLPRVYRLQCEIADMSLYEICLVNPTNKIQKFECVLFSLIDNSVVKREKFQIRSRGTHVIPIRPNKGERWRLEIKSHLVMARPVVFRTNSDQMDVFHG